MSEASSSTAEDLHNTPPKKSKRLTVYSKTWEEKFMWIKPVSRDKYKARCSLCNKDFSIASGGAADLKQHEDTKYHKRSVSSTKDNQLLSTFFASTESSQQSQITAAELTKVFHTVKHSLSYNSLDCDMKLDRIIYSGSFVAKQISCGRTKSEAIVKNVLAPYSVCAAVQKLRDGLLPFSIASDASNKGNQKMFPVMLRFYTPHDGIQSVLLDFYEDPKEDSISIAKAIQESLAKFNIDMSKATAYSADNASVNYGVHHSVYQHLKVEQPNLLKANCCAHVVHNCLKNAASKLDVDVELIVIRVFNHFSSSAGRRQQLKEFYEFLDIEWCELLRHVPTRWLSLKPAVERLLKVLPAVKSYFISLGDDCPTAVKQLLKLKMDGTDNPQAKECIVELYLSFISNITTVFEKAVLQLEKDNGTIMELYGIMNGLRGSLKDRMEDKFFGSTARTILSKLSTNEHRIITTDLLGFLGNGMYV